MREEAARVASELAESLGRESRRAITWVPPDRMHLTLRFIGEVVKGVSNEVAQRIAEPFVAPPFRIAVSGMGVFPPSGPPRVVWLGITEGADALARVAREVESRLGGLGIEREERPLRAHLTLGRVKGPLGQAARQALGSFHATGIGGCDVREVTLFESRLSPRGATYTALARGPLAD